MFFVVFYISVIASSSGSEDELRLLSSGRHRIIRSLLLDLTSYQPILIILHSATVFCDSTDDRREEGEELRLLSLILTVVVILKLVVMTSLCQLLLKI
jgi:hypothetical protein